jgi:uncharacterized membrane protein (DUF2068 family)
VEILEGSSTTFCKTAKSNFATRDRSRRNEAAPHDLAAIIQNWVQVFRLVVHIRYIDRAVLKASGITPNKIEGGRVDSMVYAGLFLAESIGLWFQKRWAEWLTDEFLGSS